MFTSDFIFNLTAVMGIAIKVAIILAIAITLNIIQKKLIPKALIAGLPKLRLASQDQLAARSKTMAYVIRKVAAVIIFIIAAVMVLGVIGVDISPLLATLGVAGLALGFAAQNIIRDYLHGFFILMEDWYRGVRARHDVLMTDGKPEGGKWNFDHDNRLPPPKGETHLPLPPPWQPEEDDIDARVRQQLDEWEADGVRFLGNDGQRRFAVTRSEAVTALTDFLDNRLALFGPYEDAVLWRDPFMAHSLLSVPMNLGLLHPAEVVAQAQERWRADQGTLASVEGLIRQIIGWREYVWHLYWHLGEDYEFRNELNNDVEPPTWFLEASVEEVDAACLHHSLEYVRDLGYSHHIVRLMVLSNWALQRGYSPQVMNDWFRRAFVDGYPWVMTANVIGMGLYADGGEMATKPYVSGGAYLKRMTDFCGDCVYDPKLRVGEKACPFTAGYWAFLDGKRDLLEGNHRLATAFRTLDKLADRGALVEQERLRGQSPP